MQALSLAVSALLAAQLQFPSTAKPEAPATLQFNWPAGITARVETERTRERQGASNAARTVTKSAYRMRVLPHEAGQIIRYDEYDQTSVNEQTVREQVQQILGTLMPSIVVDKRGRFVRLEDTVALKGFLTAVFDRAAKDAEPLPQGTRELVERLASDDFFNRMAEEEWNALVGAWLDYPLGSDRLEGTTEQPTPLWPDMKVPMRLSTVMLEKSECTRGGARYACALFEARSQVDQAAIEPILKRFLDGLKGTEGVKYEHLDVENVVRVRMETGTMLPHEFTATKTVNMTLSVTGQGRASMKQIDRRASTFKY